MKTSFICLLSLISLAVILQSGVQASQTGQLFKYLFFLSKLTRPAPKTPQIDDNAVRFENGYVVETVAEGNKLGVEPYSIRVSVDGELIAVDSVNSNIVRITPPLSQYSRARLVAGSFQGYTGHVDGKPSEARFSHPKGIAVDDRGNVYVADTANLAIRKIGESGVTTISGGKSGTPGYMDGPSEDAKFSSDFDVLYLSRTCSLLIVDRGNSALRQISLQQEDCGYESSSVSVTDILMVIGAVLAGYASCVFHQGVGPFFSKKKKVSESELEDEQRSVWSTAVEVERIKEESPIEWPSLRRLITDLIKLALEAIGNLLLSFLPYGLQAGKSKKGLTPLKDSLVMPEYGPEPSLSQSDQSTTPSNQTPHVFSSSSIYTQQKFSKSKSGSLKDPSLFPDKHKFSLKRQELTGFYGSSEAQRGQYAKGQKDRTRHRHRDKSGDISGAAVEGSTSEMKPVDYSSHMFDHHSTRSKFGI